MAQYPSAVDSWLYTATGMAFSNTLPKSPRPWRNSCAAGVIPPSSAEPWRSWALSSSSPTPPRPRGVSSGRGVPSRTAWSLRCDWLALPPSIRPTRCSRSSCLASTRASQSIQLNQAQSTGSFRIGCPWTRSFASSTSAQWPTTTPSSSTTPPFSFHRVSTGPATLEPKWKSKNASTAVS